MKVFINSNNVSRIEISDMKPAFYLNFFSGSIPTEVKGSFGFYTKQEFPKCCLLDVTKIVNLSNMYGEIPKEGKSYITKNSKRKITYKFKTIENVTVYENVLDLTSEYNVYEKLGIVCNERHIEADFNIINTIKKFLQTNNHLTNEYLESLLISDCPKELYNFIVYQKPTVKIILTDGTEYEKYFETLESAEQYVSDITNNDNDFFEK